MCGPGGVGGTGSADCDEIDAGADACDDGAIVRSAPDGAGDVTIGPDVVTTPRRLTPN